MCVENVTRCENIINFCFCFPNIWSGSGEVVRVLYGKNRFSALHSSLYSFSTICTIVLLVIKTHLKLNIVSLIAKTSEICVCIDAN